MHLWLLQLAALCSHSDSGCARASSHPCWKDAQRAAGAGLVGPGQVPSLVPGGFLLRATGQGRTSEGSRHMRCGSQGYL